jgi:hypothetical protein
MTTGEHEDKVSDDPHFWAVITRSDDDYNQRLGALARAV